MKKILLFLIVFFSVTFVKAQDLELVSLEPEYDNSQNVEIGNPEYAYDFDITLLGSNQKVQYKAVVKNTTDYKIEIYDIESTESYSDKIDYSYDGIQKNTVLYPGEQKTIKINIETTDAESEATKVPLYLGLKYTTQSRKNPNTTAKNIFITIAICSISLFVVLYFSKKYNNKAFMVLLLIPTFIAINAIAEEEPELSITGIIQYKNLYTVTIDPNGGTYNGSTEVITKKVAEGEYYNVLAVSRENYNFEKWEVNPQGKEITDGKILVDQNISLKALWDEDYYVLTIDTDGGSYKGITGLIKNSYRYNEIVPIEKAEKKGYNFNHWDDDTNHVVGDSIEMTRDITITAKYEDKYLNVTINPNGGKFNGSEETYTASVKYNTTIDISDIVRENYTFLGWRKNNGKTITTDEITITEDTTLLARWQSSEQYTVTVDPNGGIYNGLETPQTFTVYGGTEFEIHEAERDGYLFGKWKLDDGTIVVNDHFDVERDITVQANWDDIICRINTTFYRSIMEAENAAVNGDTIVLLKDTTEVVTNSKNITLDLNNHKVTGSLTNKPRANLVIINGTIENPDGVAVTNNGILTIGIDDLKDDGTSNIINDNVAIIGSTIGLQQNNKFYFYDGYIEGDVALVGGCDGSPYYRNTFDGVIVHYYPFVSHNNEKDCQHVELEASDKAVAKTTVHGEIFYYNLQDSLATSAKTGFTVYAVRDFEAAYGLNIPAGEPVLFDIKGFNIKVGDNVTNNGTFNIIDSENNLGKLSLLGVINNNGNLSITDTRLTKLNNSNLINNKGTLTVNNSTLSGLEGTIINQMTGAGEVQLNTGTQLRSNNGTAISNAATISLKNVDIESSYRALNNDNNGTLTIDGGTIKINGNRGLSGINNARGIINLSNLTYEVTNTSNAETYGIYMNNRADTQVNVNNITMNVTGLRATYAVYAAGDSPQFNLKNSTVNSTSLGTYDAGFIYRGNNKIENGTITVKSERQGFGTYYGYNDFISGSIDVQGRRYSQVLYNGTNTVRGGTLTASYIFDENVNDAYAYGIYEGTNTILGGTITATTYGIRNGNNTIGNVDDAVSITSPVIKGELYGVYGGSNKFYDGILKGKTAAHLGGSITTTPAGMSYQTGSEGEYETCYLAPSEKYLEVNGVRYNSLTAAYEAIEGSSGTIKAIGPITTLSLLPTIETGKDITIDLNGQELNYYQRLTNKGTLRIIDSSVNKSGSLNNLSTTINNITNEGELYIDGSKIMDAYQAINNDKNGTVYLNNARITLTNDTRSIYGIYNTQGTINITNSTIEATGIANSEVYAIYMNNRNDVSVVSNGSTINVEGRKNVYAVYASGDSPQFRLMSGTVNVKCTGNSDAGFIYRGKNRIDGGTVNVESERQSYGFYLGVNEIIDGTINVKAKNYAHVLYSGTNTVRGGTLTADHLEKANTNNYSYGINEGTNTIYGGTITAGTYGIHNGNNTIGDDEGDISITTPEIKGEQYGIYGGNNKFYDGVLKGRTEAHLGGSITITPDGTAYHNELIDGYETCYLIEAGNYLVVNGVEYNSLTTAYQAITEDTGTITAIASITTSSLLPIIEEGKDVTIDLNGQTLTYYQTLTNKGTLRIIDSSENKTGSLNNVSTTVNNITNEGELIITEAKLMDAYEAIYNNKDGNVTITGGTLRFENNSRSITGIYNNQGTITMNGTRLETYGTSSNDTYTIVNQPRATNIITANEVEIESEGQRNVYVVYASDANAQFNIKDSTVTVKCTANSDAGFARYGKVTIDNTSINVKSARQAYGLMYSNSDITNANIYVEAKNYAQAIYSGTNIIRSGFVTANHTDTTNSNNYSYGIYEGNNTILGGIVTGNTFGIRNGNNTIGSDDGEISTTVPEIRGSLYGLYGGNANFYDGVLIGKTEGYLEGSIASIAKQSVIGFSTTTENNETVHLAYLIPEHVVAMIDTEEYYNLPDAVEAATEDDTILIVGDIIDYDGVVIDAEKTINIDINGKTIKMRSPFTNNGTLHIMNTSDEEAHINSYGTGYLFVNNANATLNLDNITINAKYGVSNTAQANFTGNNLTIVSSHTAVNNTGTMELNDIDITAAEYSIYGYGAGTGTINDSVLTSSRNAVYTNNGATLTLNNVEINGPVSNNSSTLTLNDLDINGKTYNNGTLYLNSVKIDQIIENGAISLFHNRGTATIKKTTIEVEDINKNSTGTTIAIQNEGTLYVLDESEIIATISDNLTFSYRIVKGINNTNQLFFEDSTLTVNGNIYTSEYPSFGIYNESGTSTVRTGDITVDGMISYGLYVNTGDLILGIPEPPNSPNYGGEFADVSLTNPHVLSKGITGIGVKNAGGHFKYYDGIIIGSTSAKPEVASDIEYLYESFDYIDEDTGYEYSILEWMRKVGG